MSMPYNNKTIEEVRNIIINGLQQQFNNKLRILPKSFVKLLSTVLAGLYITLFKQIGWLFLQIFPNTAYWGEINILGIRIRPLVEWGKLLGLGEPNLGSQWTGLLRVTVNNINTKLDLGSQLKSSLTNKIYLTKTTKVLENDTELIEINCTETGTAGNLEPGEILTFVNPLGNVRKEAVVESVVKIAIDDETEAEYRYRVVNRWRMQPQGGALSDYRIWGQEVPGVLSIYPYNDDDSPAGVLLYVSGLPSVYEDRIPSSELLIAVGKSCTYNPETGEAKRKPATAILDPDFDESFKNIKPVSIIEFDVYINGLSGITALEFSESVRKPIDDYFLSREPYNRGLSNDNNKTDLVSRNNISSVVDQVAISFKSEFDNVEMGLNEETIPSYILGRGELCKLRNLYINGVLF